MDQKNIPYHGYHSWSLPLHLINSMGEKNACYVVVLHQGVLLIIIMCVMSYVVFLYCCCCVSTGLSSLADLSLSCIWFVLIMFEV